MQIEMAQRANMERLRRAGSVLVIMLAMAPAIMADEPARRYVGSQGSDKFHVQTCEWAQKIKPGNAVYFATLEEAQAAGDKPCKVCLASVKPSPTMSHSRGLNVNRSQYGGHRD